MTGLPAGEPAPARHAGARERFALFGEVLLAGVLISLCSLTVITFPAALAAGAAHLRRTVAAESNTTVEYFRDLRAALRGGVVVGVATLVVIAVLVLNLVLATQTALPAPALVGGVSAVGLALVAVALCSAVSRWSPRRGWREAFRGVPVALREDPLGGAYLLAACLFVAVSAWQLPPLVIPAMGCLALALVAVPARRQ